MEGSMGLSLQILTSAIVRLISLGDIITIKNSIIQLEIISKSQNAFVYSLYILYSTIRKLEILLEFVVL